MHTCRLSHYQAVVLLAAIWCAQPVLAAVSLSGVSSQTSLAQLSFVGLPADRLLASGLSSPQILAASQRLREAGRQLDDLEIALSQLAAEQSRVRMLEALAAGAASNESTLQSLAVARASVQAIEGQVAALRSALRMIVLAEASPEQQALLNRTLAGAMIGIEAALALAASTETERRQLASALQAETRSQRLGESLDPEQQQLLADSRAQPQVSTAASRLSAEWSSLLQQLSIQPTSSQP